MNHYFIIIRVFISETGVEVSYLLFLLYSLVKCIDGMCSIEKAFDSILVNKNILWICLLIVQSK